MRKYVYAVTFRNEKNGHTFLIYTIRTDDNSYCFFPPYNRVKFFGRKRDAEKYAQNEVKSDLKIGYTDSRYQFTY